MQARNMSRAVRGAAFRRTLVTPMAAAAALLAAASAGAHTTPPPVTHYRVIPLSSLTASAVDINAKGQVGFTENTSTGILRAKFYDGSSVRDIGTLGGSSTIFQALNDNGQITGASLAIDAGGEVYHAYRWSKATGMQDLHRPNGTGSGSSAFAINNKGWVTGYATSANGTRPFLAFRWTPATGMASLGSFGAVSYGLAINEAGTVTGYSEGPEGPILARAFRWSEAGGLQDLVGISSVVSQGNDINEAGQIVGSGAFDTSLNDLAFLWTPQRGLINIGAAPAYLSFAEHINDKGLVIGQIYDEPVDPQGFVWSREHGVVRIGDTSEVSYAADLNNLGQVVGRLGDQAIVWTRAGGTVNLNTRIPGAPPELSLFQAEAISDNGSIVANGNTGLVLLVPSAAYHQAPVAGPIKVTGATRVNSLLSFSASFRDVDLRDTHTATWTWGDGASGAGTVSQAAGSGNVSGQHTYRKTGIYTVRLSVLDSGGKSSAVERKVTVCGCSSGVTGAGSFVSPQGASALSPHGSGVATFAFLSETVGARAGQAKSEARSEVHFNAGNLALRSTQVDAVTVEGKRVRYSGSGSGRVNGVAGYRFVLTALAGEGAAKGRVHVRISHVDTHSKAEVVDYDNGVRRDGKTARLVSGAGTAAATEGSALLGDSAIVFGDQ